VCRTCQDFRIAGDTELIEGGPGWQERVKARARKLAPPAPPRPVKDAGASCPRCGGALEPEELPPKLGNLVLLACVPCHLGRFDGDMSRNGLEWIDLSAPDARVTLTRVAHEIVRWKRFMGAEPDDPIFAGGIR
jgi:hypothetical protein